MRWCLVCLFPLLAWSTLAAGCTYDAEVAFERRTDLAIVDSPTSRRGDAGSAGPRAQAREVEEPPAAAGEPDAASAPADEPPPTEPSSEPNDSALDGIVGAHNDVRSAVIPTPDVPLDALVWSESAAAVAREWASGCTFGHNPNRGSLGENVYAASAGYGSTPDSVVKSWASESSNYDYANNDCSGVCGHYTQVVWRATTAVGCAVQTCSSGGPFGGGSWELWVCNYAPPGNYAGQRPY